MKKDKVRETVQEIRPQFLGKGGDLELTEITPDGIVKIRILGNLTCSVCSNSPMKLPIDIESTLKRNIPEIKKVIVFRKCP